MLRSQLLWPRQCYTSRWQRRDIEPESNASTEFKPQCKLIQATMSLKHNLKWGEISFCKNGGVSVETRSETPVWQSFVFCIFGTQPVGWWKVQSFIPYSYVYPICTLTFAEPNPCRAINRPSQFKQSPRLQNSEAYWPLALQLHLTGGPSHQALDKWVSAFHPVSQN